MRRIVGVLLLVGGIIVIAVLCWPRFSEPLVSAAGYSGKRFEQIVAELGQPDRSDSFRMGQPLDEMRAPLLNRYPLTDRRNRDVEIRECTWKENNYLTTLWFAKHGDAWVVIDGVRWHKSIRF